MRDSDEYLTRIRTYHDRVQSFFYASVPGAIWFIYQLTAGGMIEKFALSYQTNTPHSTFEENALLGLALAAWGIPFEFAEHNLARMKQWIAYYRSATGDPALPVQYTLPDLIVNAASKLLFDKSLLPR